MSNIEILTSLDQIPKKSNVAIYGAGGRGIEISQILNTRKDINLVSFIDDFKVGELHGIKITKFEDINQDVKRTLVVIIATIHAGDVVDKIKGVKKVCFTSIKTHLNSADYYDEKEAEEIRKDVLSIIKNYGNETSKTLYLQIIQARSHRKNRLIELYRSNLRKSKQYLDYINTGKIGYAIDGGVFDGFTSLQFVRSFPELKQVYGFDIFPEFFVNGRHSAEVISSGKFKLIHSALCETDKEVSVEKDHGHGSASKIVKKSDNDTFLKMNGIKIDTFRSSLQHKIDFMKLDLEGADFAALQGGINTIISDRPQLAISIYHSKEDIIGIPKYLMNNLTSYNFFIGHYSPELTESVLYGIPTEIDAKF